MTQRVADIYFTEFNRLFNHYYFRSIAERSRPAETLRALHLAEDDGWLPALGQHVAAVAASEQPDMPEAAEEE